MSDWNGKLVFDDCENIKSDHTRNQLQLREPLLYAFKFLWKACEGFECRWARMSAEKIKGLKRRLVKESNHERI